MKSVIILLSLLALPFLTSCQITFKKVPSGHKRVIGQTVETVDQTVGSTVSTENVGINIVPEYTLDVNGVDGIRIPVGTTAQRPANPQTGVIRFNTTRGRFEGYNGVRWVNLSL